MAFCPTCALEIDVSASSCERCDANFTLANGLRPVMWAKSSTATPVIEVARSSPDAVDSLNVSAQWKQRFRLVEKAGPLVKGTPLNWKALSYRERITLMSYWVMFFGWMWYLAKGMRKKAVTIVSFGFFWGGLLTSMEQVLHMEFGSTAFWLPVNLVFSRLAYYDYYQKMLHGEEMWGYLRALDKPTICFAFFASSFAVLVFAGILFE